MVPLTSPGQMAWTTMPGQSKLGGRQISSAVAVEIPIMPRIGLLLLAVSLAMPLQAGEPPTPAKPSEDNQATAKMSPVVMHKSPGCGCCAIWAEHLTAHGFVVESISDPGVYDLKARLGIPPAARSCHTAKVGEYFIEGHVPAADIIRLLTEQPSDIRGLSVPGMPLGSPGMEHPRPQPFQTVALMHDGSLRVYAEHAAGADHSPKTPTKATEK